MNRDLQDERDIALCVDCDGTLVRADLLHEAVVRILKRRPLMIFAMLHWLLLGKARFRARVAASAPLDTDGLPLRDEVLALIREASAAGRPIVLTSAAHRTHADALAAGLGLFDQVFATEGATNLDANAKARMLVDRYAAGRFDYVGTSVADLVVWKQARKAYVVEPHAGLWRRLQCEALVVERLDGPQQSTLAILFRALRPHQWIKNLLVFVPPVAGHALQPPVLVHALLAFVAFSLCASAVYVLNDLLDLDADRAHPRKRARAFAAGTLKLSTGAAIVPLLLLPGLALAWWVGPIFLAVLLGYCAVTTAYSARLKQLAMVDVILLATLYTSRILGGSAATDIVPSFWLLASSMFMFLSLALAKRYSELLPLVGETRTLAGRGYRASDLPVLMATGVSSGMNAVLVLAFYINAPETRSMYPSTAAILVVPALLLYWVGRLWMKTHRGEVDDDPVVFAVRDWQSLAIGATIGGLFMLARSDLFL